MRKGAPPAPGLGPAALLAALATANARGESRRRHALITTSAVLLLIVVAPATLLGYVTTAVIPMPEDQEPTALETLRRGNVKHGSVAEITSIRLKENPQKKGDSLRVEWIVTVSNTRPISEKIDLRIQLLDEDAEQLTATRSMLMVMTGLRDKEYTVKMKVEAGLWEQATHLKIVVTWTGN